MWCATSVLFSIFLNLTRVWTDNRLTEKLPIFISRDQDELCPSYCRCSEELSETRTHKRPFTTLYATECHVATNSLPLICAKNWNSLKINLNNHSTISDHQKDTRSALLSYCHDLSSLYISQTGDVPVVLAFPGLLYELVNLRRVWFYNILLETDALSTFNLLHVAPKIELIAFSDCLLTLDVKKPLFFNTPTSLHQLRLSNVSLMGEFSKHLLVNLCHTSTNTDRPNDLISLYLDRNFLKGFHRESLIGCKHLRVLQLSYNQFSGSLEQVLGMPGQMSSHGWTVVQTVAHTLVSTPGILGSTPDLEVLDLTGNFISSIQSPLWAFGQRTNASQGLLNLKSLLLSNNNLTFLARGAFQGAPNLRAIDLSRNSKLFRPVHSIPNPAMFHSYIDPLIFGGVHHLEKLYWDFSDRTCLLSEVSAYTDYGSLSTRLISLFTVRPLCSSGLVATTAIPMKTKKHQSNDVQKLNRWRYPQIPEKLSPSTAVMADDAWAPIDIASSFLCVLIGVLLLILFIILVIRSRIIYESAQMCCRKVSSTRCHERINEAEHKTDLINGGQANECPISFSLEPPSQCSGSSSAHEWTLVANRMTTSADFSTFLSRPTRQTSNTLPAGTLLFATTPTTPPASKNAEPHLNNGLTVARSNSLTNRCFVCLDQVPTRNDEGHHCRGNFYENTCGGSRRCTTLTYGNSPSHSGCYGKMLATLKPTEVTQVLVNNVERRSGGKVEVDSGDFFPNQMCTIVRT